MFVCMQLYVHFNLVASYSCIYMHQYVHIQHVFVCIYHGILTAHRVGSSSMCFHYAMLITANARHFSFTTGRIGAEPSPYSSVTVQTGNHSGFFKAGTQK